MTLHPNIIGVDLSKDTLDVFCPTTDRHWSLPNTPKACARLAADHPGARFVFEATSGCDRVLREALTTAGVKFAIVNPRRAREFARATGLLAKTDRVDARMLAEMGRRLELLPTVEPSADRKALAELVARREQIVGDLVRERNRLGTAVHAVVRRSIGAGIRALEKQRDAMEEAIRKLIASSEELRPLEARLRDIAGVGPVVAATIVADMPELGRRDRRAIAALAGLAPIANDSGRRHGKRRIWGGRRRVRRVLFIAALSASRRYPHWRRLREEMQAAGKAPKTILIAIARRLLVIMNAMLRDGTAFRSPQAA